VLIGGGDDVDRVRGDEVNGKANLDNGVLIQVEERTVRLVLVPRSKAQVMKVSMLRGLEVYWGE
jgi:hypothetical protein